jgi:hypothetical protein
MHDKDTKSLTLRVSTSNSFTVSNGSEMVTQIVSNCSNSGNANNWVLTIKDGTANAHTWFGPITLSVSNTGPLVRNFDSPVRFSDGVVVTTNGNFGVLDLSVSVLNTKGL